MGDIELRGDLVVEGVLIGVPSFTLEGNGHQILVQRGGKLDLAGDPKTGWCLWGDDVFGWQTGDRLAVAPTTPEVLDPLETIWQGSWQATVRPTNAPDFTLRDGRVMRPEVANLDRSAIIRNVSRVMMHHSAGVQRLRWLRIVDSGVKDEIAFYPLHFHLNGDSVRGSHVEGVVIEGGKMRAFVPHASSGITFTDCAAVKTYNDAFWWDPPGSFQIDAGADSSHDIFYDRCLALGVTMTSGPRFGFRLSGGAGNRAIGCHATAIRGGGLSSGFHWRNGTKPWLFEDCVSHNNPVFGFNVWQNTETVHPLERLIAYNCGDAEFDHGAYGNLYHYRDIYGDAFRLHAKSEVGEEMLTIDQASLNVLEVTKHQLGRFRPTLVTNSKINTVRYNEFEGTPSWIEYRNCGLSPDRFVLDKIQPGSIIEIYQTDALTHRWAGGTWT